VKAKTSAAAIVGVGAGSVADRCQTHGSWRGQHERPKGLRKEREVVGDLDGKCLLSGTHNRRCVTVKRLGIGGLGESR
jgi:hypothetical protein